MRIWRLGEGALSIEQFLLVNFGMDLLIVLTAQRAVSLVRLGPAVCSALAGAAVALAVHIRPLPEWARMACAVLCAGVMAAAAAPTLRPRPLGRLWLAICLVGAALGGGLLAMGRTGPGSLAWSLPVAALCCLAGTQRRSRGQARRLSLRLKIREREVTLLALEDTGNRLTEPMTGLPVAVIERAALREALGEEALLSLEREGKALCFMSLGGGGAMACFYPERASYRRGGRWVRCGAFCAAIYPHMLADGECRALLPAGVCE